ncbi:MAG: hypothetical protein LC658_11115 [Bacteroidales bacterium]|nr:hypothetical protein [Bacteroidales bacterium]
MKTLAFRFSDIVDKIYSLPIEEKVELKNLLENNIAESRRNEIASNYAKTREEEKSGKLEFSSDIDELKNML